MEYEVVFDILVPVKGHLERHMSTPFPQLAFCHFGRPCRRVGKESRFHAEGTRGLLFFRRVWPYAITFFQNLAFTLCFFLCINSHSRGMIYLLLLG